MSEAYVRVPPDWLALRESADAAARAPGLVDELRRQLPTTRPLVVHDLGAGTGSMGRWLAPRLAGAQHWVLYDRDADLLARAAAHQPHVAQDGGAVTVETRTRDITRLDQRELAGASLITASALLDVLTTDELDRVVASCTAPGCPVLVTLSVIGRIELAPADPLDAQLAAAFDAHQRRANETGRLLGPDAVDAATDAFGRRGAKVLVQSSPWRLGAADAALIAEWLTGWVGAACEQRPELAAAAGPYVRRRLIEAADGRLQVTVHHRDLLAR